MKRLPRATISVDTHALVGKPVEFVNYPLIYLQVCPLVYIGSFPAEFWQGKIHGSMRTLINLDKKLQGHAIIWVCIFERRDIEHWEVRRPDVQKIRRLERFVVNYIP